MGYYSFYKIFKDIIRTLFGNKALRLVIIFGLILLALSLKTTVFGAYDTTIECSDFCGYDLEYDSSLFGGKDYVVNVFKQSADKTFINFTILISNYDITHYSLGSSNDYITLTVPKGYKRYMINSSIDNYTSYNQQTASAYLQNYINEAVSRYNSSSNLSYNARTNLNYTSMNAFSSNKFIYVDNEPIYDPTPIKYPEVATSMSDLQSLNFDVISVNAWDFSNQDIDILFYDLNYGTDTTDSLYPKNVITLNQSTTYFQENLSADPSRNAIYWIPNTETGLNFIKNGNYAIRFAERNYNTGSGEGTGNGSFGDASGGGFRGDTYTYNYLGDILYFTISNTVSDEVISSLNMSTKEKTEEKQHDETMDAINSQKEQDAEFYNNILSDDYNENQANDTLSGMTSSSDSVDNSQYVGLFSAVFGKFSNIINGNYSSVEEIHYPLPYTDKEIVIASNLLSSKIQGTWIYMFLQAFWTFLFGMYIFKFSNNLIRKIKDGSILNGYENNNEVITSSML